MAQHNDMNHTNEPIVTERKEIPEETLKRHLTMYGHRNIAHNSAIKTLEMAKETEERVRGEVRELHRLVFDTLELAYPELGENETFIQVENMVYHIKPYHQNIHPITIKKL